MSIVLICFGCIAVLSFSSESHSSNNSASNRYLVDYFRYNYNTLRDEPSSTELSANSATENVNVQSSSTDNVNHDHNSSSSNRHLSKHIKQLKEQSQQFDYYYRHAPLNIDYTQFSCDSMNDPDLLVQLHERLKNEWSEEDLELKKKRRRKRKKKMKKRMVDSDIDDELQSVDDSKGIDDGRQLSVLSDNTMQEEQDGHTNTLESSLLLDKCQFAKTCNDGEGVGFGATLFCSRRHTRHESSAQVPSSTTAASEDGSINSDEDESTANDNSTIDNYTTTASFYIKQTLTILLLLLTLFLLFRLLNSTTDEFFSPGLEHFSLQLGLPPRFAGVTLLALGNGAPDVAAIVNATLDSTEGYLMALGELTGTGMFVSGVILGVIVGLNDERGSVEEKSGVERSGQRTIKRGIPCQGPLLRDIAVLILVCVVAMSYLERGVVDYGFVYTLLAMYFVYVLTVLGADAYHLLYHLPRVRRSGSGVINGSFSDGESGDASMEVGERGVKCNGKGEGDVVTNAPSEQLITNEQTPLVASSSSQKNSYHHQQQSLPLHTHSIRDTVIEAMSNYTCDEEHQQEEQIVIFHPHHAVHPHHENGAMFLHSVFRGSDAFRRGNSTSPKTSRRSSRQLIRKSVSDGITSFRSWSNSDSCRVNQNNSGVSSTRKGVKRLSSPDRLTTAISTSSPVHPCDEECVQPSTESCNNNKGNESVALCCSSLQRPSSWGEAWKVNVEEFKEHWNDFFLDIYYNEENGALDVILLSMELPFTIIRKLTNPVPCDGYYCRPLVAVSIIFSPLWLWYYFNDQFGYDLFSTYIGYVLCGLTLLVGIIVMRFAPGGDGPMDLYMVVPLTLYGFAIAATWLDSIADKLVELLELFGILLEIPSTIMGLTVLAFGNSLQDLIADVSLSRKGLSTMAVTACLAGPIFNLCVGLGLGFWALLKSTGEEEIHVKFPTNIKTGFYFTIANCLLIVFAGMFVGKGVLGRGYGILACGLYLVYVVTSLYV